MTQNTQEVWMEVRGRLRAFIAKRVAADAAVEDLLQEVFLKIHDKIDQVQDPRRLVSWIFTVTRHVIIDYYRTSHRHREIPTGLATDVEALMAADEPEDESDEPRMQLAGCLRPMVDQLAPEYRDALTSRRTGGTDPTGRRFETGPVAFRHEIPCTTGPSTVEGPAARLLSDSTRCAARSRRRSPPRSYGQPLCAAGSDDAGAATGKETHLMPIAPDRLGLIKMSLTIHYRST